MCIIFHAVVFFIDLTHSHKRNIIFMELIKIMQRTSINQSCENPFTKSKVIVGC